MYRLSTKITLTGMFTAQWPGLVVWAAGWSLLPFADRILTLGTMAMLLVLTATIAALWVRPWTTLLMCSVSVLAFYPLFVPSRIALTTDPQQIPLLVLAMFLVSVIVTMLMNLLRGHAAKVERQAQTIEMLRNWGDTLRDARQIQDCLPKLQQLLKEVAGADAVVMVLRGGLPEEDLGDEIELAGTVDARELVWMWRCLRNAGALGPGSGQEEGLQAVYLPLRGGSMAYGAALVRTLSLPQDQRAQLQALCDQMGMALERQHSLNQQLESDQIAREQTLRATLLTAISHDFRTPLATIMSSASVLDRMDSRLNDVQRHQLASRIVEESDHLRRMTTNILELARLDAPGVVLHCDWQSAEELVGSAVNRCREQARIQVKLDAGLPWLWCDALLVSQLLDNLIDNACKYSTLGSPIVVAVENSARGTVFRVSDAGPGIPPELQQLVFQPFHQGQALTLGGRTGVGLGLALCRIVAAVHGGELDLKSSAAGTSFEFLLPNKEQPATPECESEPAWKKQEVAEGKKAGETVQ